MSQKHSEEESLKAFKESIDTFIDNKDAKEYYARKNFWATVRAYYFILKIIAVVVGVAIIYCLLARLLKFQWSDTSCSIIPWESKPKSQDNPFQEQPQENEQDVSKLTKDPILRAQEATIQLGQGALASLVGKKAVINNELYENIMKQLREF